MSKSRFFHHRVVMVLIAITIALFLTFDVVTQFLIKSEFDERAKDSIKFQASETVEILRDLEDGMYVIGESMEFNVQRALKSHIDIVLGLMDGVREPVEDQSGIQMDLQDSQIDVLRRVDAYRKNIEGTIAIFSLDKGMLLYPDGDSGRINIYFNEENKDILDQAMTEGGLYGAIQTTDMLQGESVLKGYFAYDETWNWLIFAVKGGDESAAYREYGEYITIREGIERAQSYEIVESAFVLDSHYFYEYGVDKSLIGRKITKIDLKTNKNLSEIYSDRINDFAEYVIKNPETGEAEEKLAYVLESDDKRHIVVVETDIAAYRGLTNEIIKRLRFMTVIAIASLIMILFLLYQNFVTLLDPIAEQGGA